MTRDVIISRSSSTSSGDKSLMSNFAYFSHGSVAMVTYVELFERQAVDRTQVSSVSLTQ